MSYTRQFAVLIATLALAFDAGARINSWTSAGPEGGFTTAVTASPQDPMLLLAGTSGGMYRSVNGGATWQQSPSPYSVPVNFTFNPARPTQVCAANNNLVCSSDGGESFLYVGNDRQPQGTGNGIRDIWFTRDGVYLYAATAVGRVYRTLSTDIGNPWTEVMVPWPSDFNKLTAMAVDPNDANILYVAVLGSGVYKTVNGGTSWTLTASGPGSGIYIVNQIVVRPGDSNRVVIAANDGVYVSANGGATWAHAAPFGVRTVAIDPLHPDTVVAAGYGGVVLRSADGGDSFPTTIYPLQLVYQPMRLEFDGGTPSRLLLASGDGPLVSTDAGDTFTPIISGIRAASLRALTSSDAGAVYAAFSGPAGVFRRTNAGWQGVNNANLFAALSYNMILYEVATAPQDGNVIYVVAHNDHIVKSVDGGTNWTYAGNPLLNGNRSFRRIVIDPTNTDIAYAGSYYDGVYKTVDGGANWIKRSTGLPTFITSLAIDRNDPRVVYAGAVQGNTGVFKSVDGGASWNPTGPMPEQFGVNEISIDASDSRIVFASMNKGLLKSTDAGATWNMIDPNSNAAATRGVHVDLTLPSTVNAGFSSSRNGFVRSVDSGALWQLIEWPAGSNIGNGVDAALVDRVRPGLVITGGYGTGIMEYEVAPDLAVTLDVPAVIDVGATVNATMTVRHATGPASSVAIAKLTLPPWLTAAPPPGCTLAGQTVTCRTIGLRAVNDVHPFVIPVTASATPAASGNLVAQLETHEFDPDTTNNQVTVQAASAVRADLWVTPVAGSRTAVRNGAVSLALMASNTGPATAANTRVTITIPAGISLNSAVTTVGTCTSATPVICSLGSLANGANATITLNGTAVTAGNAVIDATIISDAIDVAAGNNAGSATFTISEAPPASGGGASGGGGGGGGGGGRFDWLGLVLLGALGWRRTVSRAAGTTN